MTAGFDASGHGRTGFVSVSVNIGQKKVQFRLFLLLL